MAGLATPSQPRNIPGAALTVSTPAHLSLPSPTPSLRPTSQLPSDQPFSPVNQNGSFEFDRIVKQGQVLKRTRKTKSWKPIYMVLRPNLLSIYRDKSEAKLRHQINLADLTAVARQNDPKRREKHVFGLFSPSRNFHLEASSDAEAQDWVEHIRREARIDEEEEEMYLASPGGGTGTSPYSGFGRSIDAQLHEHDHGANSTRHYSSSDLEGGNNPLPGSLTIPRQRERRLTPSHPQPPSTSAPSRPIAPARQPSYADFSGPDHGSLSDFSDSNLPAARLSALSLAPTTTTTDGRPSTSSARPPTSTTAGGGTTRPSIGQRSASQMSLGLGPSGGANDDALRAEHDKAREAERVVYQGWTWLLKSKSGVRQWKKAWLVLRARGLALYKDETEYAATLVVPLAEVINAVEIDAVSKSKTACMQLITDERTFRFAAPNEEALAKLLGAWKSLLAKRNAARKERDGVGAVAAST